VLITSPSCRWCRRFERETLADPAIRRRLGRLAVTAEVVRGSGEYPATLAAPVVPMHYFLGEDGEVLVKMPGYWSAEDFMSILDDVERRRK
jgi:thioredoxin-related protein